MKWSLNDWQESEKPLLKSWRVESYDKIDDTFFANLSSHDCQRERASDFKTCAQTKESLTDKEFRLTALSSGVKPEHLDRAVRLAKTELSDTVTIEQALELVLEDFPMLKGGEQPVRKVGAETRNEVGEKTEIDRYLDKYKSSKYFQK
jgi:hypothetical protein